MNDVKLIVALFYGLLLLQSSLAYRCTNLKLRLSGVPENLDWVMLNCNEDSLTSDR